MFSRFIYVIIIMLICFSTLRLQAGDKKRVTVLNFYADNVPESFARITRNSLEVYLYNKGNQFQLLERAQVKMIFEELKIKGDECKDTSCLVDVGKTLSADFAISGSISMLEEYRIVIKLVSITNAEIAAVYSKDFDNEDEIDPVIDRITDKIIEDIAYYAVHNTTIRPVIPSWWETTIANTKKFLTSFDYICYAGVNYFQPFGKLTDILNPGYGITVEGCSGNIFFKNFYAGISAGAAKFAGKENDADSCILMSGQFVVKYRINLSDKLDVFPAVSSGINYIHMKHGTGAGFKMDENSSKYGYDPVAEGGFDLNYRLFNTVFIALHARYGMIFEHKSSLQFADAGAGVNYAF